MSLTPTEQEVRAFVGPNADYYLGAWRRALAGEGGASGFNVAGFFLAGPWLVYRKMYAAMLILLGIVVVQRSLQIRLLADLLDPGRKASPESIVLLSLLPQVLLALVVGLVVGFGGNRWYLARARRAIEKVRSKGLPEEAHLQALSLRGGASLAAALGLAGLIVVAACMGR